MSRFLTKLLAMASPAAHVPIPRRGVDYRGKVVLAPMVRSGELPCRLLALHYGADLVWGPETIDQAMIGTSRRHNPRTGTVEFTRMPSHPGKTQATESIIYTIDPEIERGRLIFQLGTAKPSNAVKAATLVAPDVAGIDVNAGCPKAFSTSGGMGAALLKDPERLASILEALVKEVGGPYEIGISVKIRILPDPALTEALVRRLVRTGITGLTVHCRTPSMRPRERAIRQQLRMVGDICRQAGVACLLNGDVADREAGLKLAEEYGVDGAMIATAAEADPSVFRPEGRAPWRETARLYLQGALRVENRWGNTKFTLAQILPGKADEGRKCQVARCYKHVVEATGFEEFAELAEALDERLGLGDPTRKKSSVKEVQELDDGAATQEKNSSASVVISSQSQRGPERAAHLLEHAAPSPLPAVAV